MANMTAQEIIETAYRKNAIMNTSSTQLANGLSDLQDMLSMWSADGLTVPYYTFENFTLTSGQAVYTIGDDGGEDFSTARPNRIVGAFIRISTNDYPVDVNMTRSGYRRIFDKAVEGRPRNLYYDPQYPSGNINFDYEADTTYDFHIESEKPLVNPSLLSTTFSIPQEFNIAMWSNLAVLLAADNDNQLPQDIRILAGDSLDAIMTNNMGERHENTPGLPEISRGFGYGTYMDINSGY